MKGDTTWFVTSCNLCPYYKEGKDVEYCKKVHRAIPGDGFPEWCPGEPLQRWVQ